MLEFGTSTLDQISLNHNFIFSSDIHLTANVQVFDSIVTEKMLANKGDFIALKILDEV